MAFVKHIFLKNAPRLLPQVLKLLFTTLKIEIRPAGKKLPDDGRGLIFAFWHGRMVTGWLLAKRLFPGRSISSVVSLSGDGQILSDTLGRLGFGLIRGSSSRGKEEVRSGIVSALQNNHIAAVTPDGPRGPQHRFKYGTVRIASEQQTPIVFAEITHEHARILKSWDRFEIPLPFSRVFVHIHLIEVPAFPSEEALRAFADELSTRFAP